jgi:hypothetical protein
MISRRMKGTFTRSNGVKVPFMRSGMEARSEGLVGIDLPAVPPLDETPGDRDGGWQA